MKTIYSNEQFLIKRSRELWKSEHNQKAWVSAVLLLGEKWLLRQPVQKIGAKS